MGSPHAANARAGSRGPGALPPGKARAARLIAFPEKKLLRSRRRTSYLALANSNKVTVASNAVGSHARITGLRLNTIVPLSISRCSRKERNPDHQPQHRARPRPRRPQRAQHERYREQHRERDRHRARDLRPEREQVLPRIQRVGAVVTDKPPQRPSVSCSGSCTARPRNPAVTLDCSTFCAGALVVTRSPVKRDSV